MASKCALLDEAATAGVLKFPHEARKDSKSHNLVEAAARIESFSEKAKGRVTLFLGAAISTFKPAQLPMWNDFVELLWTSALNVAVTDIQPDTVSEGILGFFDRLKNTVPNYMVTEVISRRLGQQYLQVLDAFRAEKREDGAFAFNKIHTWAAELLSAGAVAAVMTTNFDNYLEKAIESKTSLFYQVVGDPHVDGKEISARLPLTSSAKKLVLIVNGAKAFAFIRSLMPQLGNGKVTFLFKIHGSCYDPVSCIDTRLQRAQGLPSFATDVLDILLKRTVWLVAGFSGSDMNDNLDYLRFLSNKRQASIIWLMLPQSPWESSMEGLTQNMDLKKDSPVGFCLLNGYFLGERHSGESKFPRFEQKIKLWAEGLGPDWCKLLLIDLITLFEERSAEKAYPELLQRLNGGTPPRQDWNGILQHMDLQTEESQVGPAKCCAEVWETLSYILEDEGPFTLEAKQGFCNRLNEGLKELGLHHAKLEEAALLQVPARHHAQTWVVSALSGLAMLCGGKMEEAARALRISSGVAWVVGNYESRHLIEDVLAAILHQPAASTKPKPANTSGVQQSAKCVAFSPSLDNVNAKMNRFGVPPENYMRALLHRSILFADGMVVPPNTITNSTVFVDEILFQGERDQLDEVYMRHVFPILSAKLKDGPRKLQRCRETRAKLYIFEPVNEDHIAQMDDYFDDPANAHQILYYDEPTLSRDYGRYLRAEVDPLHREETIEHLVQLWNHIEAGGHWDVDDNYVERSSIAKEAAQDLSDSLHLLSKHLPEAVFRSPLYKFADLFDEASDRDSVIQFLTKDTGEKAKLQLLKARDRIVEKPWLYGPFCHEIFDAPYRATLTFDYASRAENETLIFLEDDEVPSWQFMSSVAHVGDSQKSFSTCAISSGSHKYSSLLLSQMPAAALLDLRDELAPVREKIFHGVELSADDVQKMKSAMRSFENRSLVLPEVEIQDIIDVDQRIKGPAKKLLSQCLFLVRKGLPLEPMYEEAQVTLPGLLALRREGV
ncbi:SIR2-like domain-containing protein [Cladophialophora immunda]|nr:SIR2-like domain-containing protein [Cladophialophora immunda]